ncbi:hypothetical protein DMC01_03870 [Campylobacter troglodytis]|nr:hypothetical protein DMC01_03870 [Campylobacter troglodytis]
MRINASLAFWHPFLQRDNYVTLNKNFCDQPHVHYALCKLRSSSHQLQPLILESFSHSLRLKMQIPFTHSLNHKFDED